MGFASAIPSARRQETLGRLFGAATEVFAEDGLQGASVEAICSRAGFTRGAFYSNFASKEELFVALFEREFQRRAQELKERASDFGARLQAQGECITPQQAAHLIIEFFASSCDTSAWFVLETEFLLLALRDPKIAPAFRQIVDRLYLDTGSTIEGVLATAGRRFSLPPERATVLLINVYQQMLRTMLLADELIEAQTGLAELGEHMAELLFLITEEIKH